MLDGRFTNPGAAAHGLRPTRGCFRCSPDSGIHKAAKDLSDLSHPHEYNGQRIIRRALLGVSCVEPKVEKSHNDSRIHWIIDNLFFGGIARE